MTVCTHADFVRLVLSFPVLGGRAGLAPAPGVAPDGIHLEMLDRWASGDPEAYTSTRGPFPGEAAKDAVRFVLAVFSTHHKWKVGTFDMWHALATWDEEQRAAFGAWWAYPVRP